MTLDFIYEFKLNTMNPNKDDETIYLIDQIPNDEAYHHVMKQMGVDVSIQKIGYCLSDQKESVWTHINNLDDFSCAVEAQCDVQSHVYKAKHLHIIHKVCGYYSHMILYLTVILGCGSKSPEENKEEAEENQSQPRCKVMTTSLQRAA